MEKEIISVMKRYELKYILNKEQLAYFQEEILKYMKIDKYGLTTISSVYYDTPNCTLINKSIEKPAYKEKIRLRSYGLAKDDSPVFLEIKRKNEKIVYKRRIVTTEKKVDKFFNQDEEFGQEQISRELLAFKENYGVLIPKYLIIYDRVAYYQDNSDLRITIDMNPRYRVEDLNLHTSNEGIYLLNEGEAILEVKVQHSVPLWLVKILTEAKIYQNSFSKVGNAHKREMGKLNKKETLVKEHAQINIKGGYQYGFTV
ncbi:MAG: polyphosphate polymerase domain-containing protein [Bacilli bacterium]|nr:polyphosphate polymerase domain-containing protein [Bacilli bacterium]